MRSSDSQARTIPIVIILCLGILPHPGHSSPKKHCPINPGEKGWLEQQMHDREQAVSSLRKDAIRLLKQFLTEYPKAPERAEALFRLAELHWEQAEAKFLARMSAYDRQLEAYRDAQITKRPAEPGMDLDSSLHVYEEILQKHPYFERSDMVMYLYGFGLNEKGDEQKALAVYKQLVTRYPHSAFVPDAQFAIGEYRFSKGRFAAARISYQKVLPYDTPLAELALYKSAWCHFKEGQVNKAAASFRKVLERSKLQKEKPSGSSPAMVMQLENEVLEDLALTFSESGGANQALSFMRQVGGKEYFIRVLQSLGNVFFHQARYTKSIDSFRILLEHFPLAPESPAYQEKIAESFQLAGKMEPAIRERLQLVEKYGPGSAWFNHYRNQKQILDRGLHTSEESLRYVATYRHNQAQKRKDRRSYQLSAAAYRKYLDLFGNSQHAPKLQFYLGETLNQLGQYQQAAIHYQKAGRQMSHSTQKIEAAYSAILAYDQLRPKDQGKEPPAEKQDLTEHEQSFVRSVEEFIKLAPQDRRLAQLRFEVGKIAYLRGHYDSASQQFLGLIQSHPKHAVTQSAADLALDCHARTKQWNQLEKQAKRFTHLGIFRGKELGKKLSGFVTGSIFQQASRHANVGRHIQAAREFQRLATEYPRDPTAPKALLMAASQLEEAGEKKEAITTYKTMIKKYPRQAPEAILALAGMYERQFDYQKATFHYNQLAQRYKSDPRAPDALLQAALLHRASENHLEEAKKLTELNSRYPKHAKAAHALFLAGLALEKTRKYHRAEKAFKQYLVKHASSQGRYREVNLHLGQIMLKRGRIKQAQAAFDACGSFSPKNTPKGAELAAAAQCLFMRGEMYFREYSRIRLKPPKKRLIKRLGQKATILKKAEAMFTKVVAAGHMEWASAALYRIGDMYAQLSSAIFKAPQPRGLSASELANYRRQLENLAYPIEDKALSAFSISHQMAIKHDYHSHWTLKTKEMLLKLDPANHPKEEEVRPGTGWTDSHKTFPLMMKPLPGSKIDDQGSGALERGKH